MPKKRDAHLRVATSGLALLVGMLGAALPAAAQQSPAAPQAQPAPATPTNTQESANDLIVVAQRREQSIQDVPVAISAFTQETLNVQKIEAGPDLLKAVPNLTFSKSNFAGFNLSIRGIGTKAISVSTDPGVAINFNSTTLITNRFFEQEFFDLERIEVLRGPQGTLYGRNATGGVVNIISAKPKLDEFEGYVKLEGGNFASRRAQGAINIPIASDVLGLRLAGAYTKRNGFTTNDITANRVDGRDLYTTRATLGFEPASSFRADLVWERFSEDDNRARTAKQLCHRDPGLSTLGGVQLTPASAGFTSQGCRPGSLYEDDAYGVPNGLSLAYVLLGQNSFIGANLQAPFDIGGPTLIRPNIDPYADTTQTRDLRRISAAIDPRYRANANVYQLNANWDFTDTLQITSQTVYNKDRYNSTQDYNRFNTREGIFTDSNELPEGALPLTPGGFYTDPQLGRQNRLVAQDLVDARSKQFSQELRLSTTGNGPLQVTAGANYTYYKNETDYFIFINALTGISQSRGIAFNNSVDPLLCSELSVPNGPQVIGTPGTENCIYIDPNPIGSLNREGHNYFRSNNRYELDSYGIFADGTYQATPELTLIAGVRYNIDNKRTTPVPSQLLLSQNGLTGAGTVNRGYPALPDIVQKFRAVTGRAGFQWKPEVSYTDETMVYATYSRGYKAGGTNPPPPGFNTVNPFDPAAPPITSLLSYAPTFRPEYVNSFEVGLKNTLLDRRLTLNMTGFYYDLKNYQISQIIDRSAVNENFDAQTYGVEFEAVFTPVQQLRVNANIGLQRSRLRDGQESLDVLNRTQSDPNLVVLKPFPTLPSNCVARRDYVEQYFLDQGGATADELTQSLIFSGICPGSGFSDRSIPADVFPNGGRGLFANVGGNELPNTPRFTVNFGAEYAIPLGGDWFAIPRADVYHQSESWARVYNTVADRLRGWENVNFSLRVANEKAGLLVEAYVKNAFNSTPITDTFINSDDTGLTTNVFTFDPRIIAVNISKRF